jgi:hypothetical protein
MSSSEELPLVAFYTDAPPDIEIAPAPRWRDWMNATVMRNANRCLPLLAANEAGWVLLNPRRFRAVWSGGEDHDDLDVRYEGPPPPARALSTFGSGILTFPVMFLFRTPPGFDLLARGPANMPKDGIGALEGLIETDWATSTFTMNWKFTRPGEVVFDEDEPFCMLVPQRRHDLEAFRPEIRPVETESEIAAGWEAFRNSRDDILVRKFLAEHTAAHADAREAWEGDYFRGRTADQRPAPEHKTKRRLKPFEPQG